MNGFSKKISSFNILDDFFDVLFFQSTPYPHRVHQASSPSADPPTLILGRHLFTVPDSTALNA